MFFPNEVIAQSIRPFSRISLSSVSQCVFFLGFIHQTWYNHFITAVDSLREPNMLAPVVRGLVNAVHWIISIRWIAQYVLISLIHWRAVYPLDNVICALCN